jgi:hypothetical protein
MFITAKEANLDLDLADAIRSSGITAAKADAVAMHYAVCGDDDSDQVTATMQAVAAWIRAGEDLAAREAP